MAHYIDQSAFQHIKIDFLVGSFVVFTFFLFLSFAREENTVVIWLGSSESRARL